MSLSEEFTIYHLPDHRAGKLLKENIENIVEYNNYTSFCNDIKINLLRNSNKFRQANVSQQHRNSEQMAISREENNNYSQLDNEIIPIINHNNNNNNNNNDDDNNGMNNELMQEIIIKIVFSYFIKEFIDICHQYPRTLSIVDYIYQSIAKDFRNDIEARSFC
ncbi:hypothetical protein Glove_256g162 [Diversispora epigaea]|uniref:Uncharacterized protein n=1 Tax=Diversispora epigaea TaxID=1348612 RepID=A0A397IBD3_9GLOM|nr:hypothetical protein Glove_256g162 [Diversispora epigaea]